MLMRKLISVTAFAAVTLAGGAAVLAAGDTTGGAIPVPSGMDVRWLETLSDSQGPGGLTMRFRFVAPALAKPVSEDALAADMEALCNTYALPRVSGSGPRPAQIVIAIADKAVPYGQATPSIHQYFEAYSIEKNTCVWELF